MAHRPHSLQSLHLLIQELMKLGLMTAQLARDLEQRVLSLEEQSESTRDCHQQNSAPKAAQNPANKTPAKIKNGKTARASKRDGLRPSGPAQCRACGRDVFRLPDDSALFNEDGTPRAASCTMRHIVCRDAVAVAVAE